MWYDSIWDEFEKFHKEFFYDWMTEHPALPGKQGRSLANSYRRPLADFYETDNDVVVNLEMPGVNKDDIQVNLNDNSLEIKVEKKSESSVEEKGVRRYERTYGGFYRCFALPRNVDSSKINAKYEDGILNIKIPKIDKSDNLKRIEVK